MMNIKKILMVGKHPHRCSTLLATDIVGSASQSRDTESHIRLRDDMYQCLREAFKISGIPARRCHQEDRGDGALFVASPRLNPEVFLDPLLNHLNAVLGHHNRHTSGSTNRLRMRVALHHGPIRIDHYGVAGPSTILLFRMLDARALRQALARSSADVGAVVSDKLYTEVTERVAGLTTPTAYRPIHLSNKETHARAWLWLPR